MKHSIFRKRGLVVPRLYLSDKTVEAAEENFPARYESIQQFTLSNAACQILTTYCADQKTPALEGYGYRLVNLEDATYYTEDNAKMIRTIANNGYWGAESGYGSLEAVKQRMASSGKFTEDEVAGLTDGMAMTATQYAVWTFSNAMDEKTFVNVYYANKSGLRPSVEVEEEAALIFKLYRYLIGLPPTAAVAGKATTRNVIINENNFLKRIALTVKDKAQEHPNNLDEEDTNDAYYADISFELVVEPSTENGDDLVLKIENEAGECIAIGRVAGTLQEGEVQLKPNDSGEYRFCDIIVEEGVENVRFVLSGTQYLDKTPYLLTSEIRAGVPSQTMVCVAEGNRNVNVEMALTFELRVEEETILADRAWRTEKTIPIPPESEPPTEPSTEPTTNPPTEPSTEPPDSDNPKTGEESDVILWAFWLLLSALAVIIPTVHRDKRMNKAKHFRK